MRGLGFQVVDYPDQKETQSHADGHAQIVFSLKGRITQTCRKQTLLLNPCSLVFLPLGESHVTHFQEDVRAFQIALAPQWEEHVRQASTSLDRPLDFENGLPVWLAMRLYREFQQRDNVTSLMLEGLVLELMATMSRHTRSDVQRRLPRWLRQARDLLHDRFTERVSIDEIATAVSVHPSHLMDGFRQHYGCTPGDYIRKLRVEYATHLLHASDMSASQIAFAAGFSDQSHFCRTFKAFTRMTPTEFKNAVQ
jgi:AraC family transcriptional regulator